MLPPGSTCPATTSPAIPAGSSYPHLENLVARMGGARQKEVRNAQASSSGPGPEGTLGAATDRALLLAVRAGDQDAFACLLSRYWTPLLGFVVSLTGSEAGAEDVAQEVFIRIWAHREAWDNRGSPRAYLYRIARNLALNARRDRQTAHRRLAPLPTMETSRNGAARAKGADHPEHRLAVRTLEADIRRAIDALPSRRREVFTLARFQGLSHREIAETLGIASQTVANHMRLALEELREALRSHLED